MPQWMNRSEEQPESPERPPAPAPPRGEDDAPVPPEGWMPGMAQSTAGSYPEGAGGEQDAAEGEPRWVYEADDQPGGSSGPAKGIWIVVGFLLGAIGLIVTLVACMNKSPEERRDACVSCAVGILLSVAMFTLLYLVLGGEQMLQQIAPLADGAAGAGSGTAPQGGSVF